MKLSEIVKNWKTTLLALIPIAISILVMTGVISVEDQVAVQDGVTQVIESADVSVTAILALISGISGVIGLFSKDGDK